MGFSNIAKHKYSWALNIIRSVYLKVNRWYLHKVRCDKKKYPNNRELKKLPKPFQFPIKLFPKMVYYCVPLGHTLVKSIAVYQLHVENVPNGMRIEVVPETNIYTQKSEARFCCEH